MQINTLADLKSIDITDLTYQVNCFNTFTASCVAAATRGRSTTQRQKNYDENFDDRQQQHQRRQNDSRLLSQCRDTILACKWFDSSPFNLDQHVKNKWIADNPMCLSHTYIHAQAHTHTSSGRLGLYYSLERLRNTFATLLGRKRLCAIAFVYVIS